MTEDYQQNTSTAKEQAQRRRRSLLEVLTQPHGPVVLAFVAALARLQLRHQMSMDNHYCYPSLKLGLKGLATVEAVSNIASAQSHIFSQRDVDDPKDLNGKTKLALNDNSLWNTEVPRAYLFSTADKLTKWKSVLEHAQRSERRGTPVVAVEVFEKSAHCAHIRNKEDADRYWSAVQKVWDAKVSGASNLVEWDVLEGKKDVVDVVVEEMGRPKKRLVVKRCNCSDCGR